MSILRLENHGEPDILPVPGIFIDYYLPAASGQDIKVFLYLLRMAQKETSVSTGKLASDLDISEQNVLDSLDSWQETGLLHLKKDSIGQVEAIEFLDIEKAAEQERGGFSGGAEDTDAPAVSRAGETGTALPSAAAADSLPSQPAGQPGGMKEMLRLPDAEYEKIRNDPGFVGEVYMMQNTLGRMPSEDEQRRLAGYYRYFGGKTNPLEQAMDAAAREADGTAPSFESIEKIIAEKALGSAGGSEPPQSGGTGSVMPEEAGAASGGADSTVAAPALEKPQPASARTPRALTAGDEASLSNDPEFTGVTVMAEQMQGHPASGADLEKLSYWYVNFGRSSRIMEELIDYCVTACYPRKPVIGYLDKVARTWFENGITTAQDGWNLTEGHNHIVGMVLKAFGFGPRNRRDINEAEEKMIERWTKEWNMSPELIQMACERTAAATSKNQFSYANAILSRWHQSGISTPEDVQKDDEAHFAANGNDNGAAARNKLSKSAQRAHNFEERNTDYDAAILEQIRQRHQKS